MSEASGRAVMGFKLLVTATVDGAGVRVREGSGLVGGREAVWRGQVK